MQYFGVFSLTLSLGEFFKSIFIQIMLFFYKNVAQTLRVNGLPF